MAKEDKQDKKRESKEQILEQTKAEQEYRKESFKDLEKAGVFKRIEEKLE